MREMTLNEEIEYLQIGNWYDKVQTVLPTDEYLKLGWAIGDILGTLELLRSLAPEPETNADRIRAMSDEELAEYLAGVASGPLLRLAEQFGVPLTSEKNEKYIAELKTEYLKRLQSPENGGLTWNG